MEISKGLTNALLKLGIPCDVQKAKKEVLSKDICYDVPSIYEVTIDGKKLIGSAQYRNEKYVLQHGSIPIKFDYDNYINSFTLKNKEKMKEHLKKNVADINEYLNDEINFDQVLKNFGNEFSKIFDQEIYYENIKEEEIFEAKKIKNEFIIEL
jgi:lipoate-protein ligase A